MSFDELASRPHVVGSTDHAADRLAISEVIGAYGLYYDTSQWAAFADLFAADAKYNISPDPKLIPLPLQGNHVIAQAMRERREMTGDAVFPRHLATNIVFSHIDSGHAGTSSFLIVIFTYADGRIVLQRSGTYVDEFRKDGTRWRFAKRHLHLDTAAAPPSR